MTHHGRSTTIRSFQPQQSIIMALRGRNSINHLQQVRSISTSLVDWKFDEATRVGTITLSSPKTMNALTVEMGQDFERLTRILQDFVETQDIHAIVLQGAGDQAFSAGGNLEWLQSLHRNPVHKNVDAMLSFYNSFMGIRTLPIPIIVALQGPAMGAGACLALACDMRVATRDKPAILGFPFSKLGIHSGMAGSWLLQTSGVPKAKVHEILFTGQTLSSQQSLDLGLVNRVVDDAKIGAMELAVEVAQQHPVAIRSMVRTMRLDHDGAFQSALQREAYAQAVCYHRNDWGEGLKAIAEKRSPQFDNYHVE